MLSSIIRMLIILGMLGKFGVLTASLKEHVFVHTTNYLPYPTLKVGGRKILITENEDGTPTVEDIPKEFWKPFRVTLHWGLNASIPAEDTVTRYKDEVIKGTLKRAYGLIEPFESLRPQIYGGYIRDFYSIGEHHVSSHAILIVPNIELEDLRHQFPEATIVGYDFVPGKYDASLAVNDYLKGTLAEYDSKGKFHFCDNELSLSLSDLIQHVSGTKEKNLYEILRRIYQSGDISFLEENRFASLLTISQTTPTIWQKLWQPGYWMKVLVPYNMVALRQYRKVIMDGRRPMLEQKFFSTLGLDRLPEAYYLHCESELFKLERKINDAYKHPSYKNILAITSSLTSIQKNIDQYCPTCSKSFDTFIKDVLEHMAQLIKDQQYASSAEEADAY